LGPTLFLIYINDLYKIGVRAKITSFADDTSILFQSKNVNDLYSIVNKDLNLVLDWFISNKLCVNTDKSNYIIFTSAHKEKYINKIIEKDNLSVFMGGIQMARCFNIKYLGIYIDSVLSYKSHIDHVIDITAKHISILMKLRYYVPLNLLLSYYYAHIQSHIHYGIEIYALTSKSNLHIINSIVNKSVQIITFTSYMDHISPIRKKLKIPNIEELLFRSIADKMFRIVRCIGHVHNVIHFDTVNESRSLRSSAGSIKFKHKKIRTNIGKNSFDFIGCKIWNFIPEEYKVAVDSYSVFKYHMKRTIDWSKCK